MLVLTEEPSSIYISSATDDQHWLYRRSQIEFSAMLSGKRNLFLALDYTVTIMHGIKTRAQLIQDMKQFDPVTARIEYLNEVLRQNSKAYYKYSELSDCQKLAEAFYPLMDQDYIKGAKNKFVNPKIERFYHPYA